MNPSSFENQMIICQITMGREMYFMDLMPPIPYGKETIMCLLDIVLVTQRLTLRQPQAPHFSLPTTCFSGTMLEKITRMVIQIFLSVMTTPLMLQMHTPMPLDLPY